MRAYEILTEAPIGNFDLIGDFNQKGSFDKINNPDDVSKTLVQNPKAVQKIKSLWERVPQTFNFYIVNQPEKDYNVAGEVWTYDSLKSPNTKLKQLVAGHIKYDPNAISVVYTSNFTSRTIPMTGWILAHRFLHTMQFGSLDTPDVDWAQTYKLIASKIWNLFSTIAVKVYGGSNNGEYKGVSASSFLQNEAKLLINKTFTMRSARNGWINTFLDVPNELFAQYLMTGKVTFNALPDSIDSRYDRSVEADKHQKLAADLMLNELSQKLPEIFDKLLDELKGKICVFG
jgi:hypothetical protein